MLTKTKYSKEKEALHRKKLIEWFNNNIQRMREKDPEMLDRFESMDRSELVAECCRLHLVAIDYLAAIIHMKEKEETPAQEKHVPEEPVQAGEHDG